MRAIDELADPFYGNVCALEGHGGFYRKRQGDYRIIYSIDRTTRTVYIEDILPRGDAYK